MQYISFLRAHGTSSKEMTTQLHSNFGMANVFALKPKVSTLKGFKVWTQHYSKRKPLN